MRLVSLKTYRIIRFALENREFKQLEAHKKTGVSFGRVNFVTNWLVAHGYVARSTGVYIVIAPAALAQQFSFFRRMEALKTASFMVEASGEELLEVLAENHAALCSTSALQRYDDYFRDPSIHAYAGPQAIEALKQFSPGRTSVTLYRDDFRQEDDFEATKEGFRATKKTRTIIDVLCSQRAYAAGGLIKRTWG